MANLPESAGYVTGIYQLETTDPLEGGAGGILNRAWSQLASRTKWLKDQLALQAWQAGDIKEITCNSAYITANFNGTGLGINLRAGWAICNGANGTIDKGGRVGVGHGNGYTVGQTGGSKDAVVVLHTHTQGPHSHKMAVGDVDGSGGGSTTTGPLKRGINYGNDSNYDLRGSTGATPDRFNTESVAPVINSTGENGTDKNMQPYVVTLFIQKL